MVTNFFFDPGKELRPGFDRCSRACFPPRLFVPKPARRDLPLQPEGVPDPLARRGHDRAGDCLCRAAMQKDRPHQQQINSAEAKSGATVHVQGLDSEINSPVIISALSYSVAEGIIKRHAKQLSGKILVDITNPLNQTYASKLEPLPTDKDGAEQRLLSGE